MPAPDSEKVFIGTHLDLDDHRIMVELQSSLNLETRRLITTAELIRIALRDSHHSRVIAKKIIASL